MSTATFTSAYAATMRSRTPTTSSIRGASAASFSSAIRYAPATTALNTMYELVDDSTRPFARTTSAPKITAAKKVRSVASALPTHGLTCVRYAARSSYDCPKYYEIVDDSDSTVCKDYKCTKDHC